MPEISIIMPAYNAAQTIPKTIQSVLDQTFTDFELIVINDGSTDQTVEQVESFQDHRIHLFSFPNAGPQKSRNRGIAKAQGTYLAFLDADDLWTSTKLADQLEALKTHPEAGFVYSWTDWIDEGDRVWRRGSHVAVEGDVLQRLLLNDFIGSGSNPLVWADAIKTVGGFDEAILGGQDWEMWLRLAAHYPVTVVAKVQVLYRKASTSRAWSNNVQRQEKGFRQVVEKTIQASPDRLQSVRRAVLGNIYKSLIVDLLERAVGRCDAWRVLRFIALAVWFDPALLKARVLYKLLARTLFLGLLPPRHYRSLVQRLGRWADAAAMYGYLRVET